MTKLLQGDKTAFAMALNHTSLVFNELCLEKIVLLQQCWFGIMLENQQNNRHPVGMELVLYFEFKNWITFNQPF